MSDPWRSMRREMPVTERWIYLAHAAVSPLPRRCQRGLEAYLQELSTHGCAHYPGPVWDTHTRARQLGARLLGAPPEGVFFVSSTSQGLAVAATGLRLRPDANVVLVEREFPANLRPWLPLRERGVELRFVPQRDGRVLLDDLAAAVDHHTLALSVSFVQFLSGFRLDPAPVAELCHRHDALFVLDAIQGLGAMPLDVVASGVDFLSADAHKWLLGPEGVGLGWASPRALERLDPAVQGWLAVERPFDFFDLDQPLRADASRFEPGAANLAGVAGLAGSLELLLEPGIPAICRRILDLTDHAAEGLRAAGWSILSPRAHDGEKSGVLLCTRAGLDMDHLGERLLAEGVVATVRGGALRLAPHAYNTPAEIDRVVAILRDL